MNKLKNKTILVTGGTGSFGSSFVKHILNNNKEILITNETGDLLGLRKGKYTYLNSDEWNNAIVRMIKINEESFKLEVQAVSTEQLNGKKAYSEKFEFNWTPSSYITNKSEPLFNGEKTTLTN